MNQMRVGDGTVVLIAGGGKVYTDVAARFTRSERSLGEIIASPYNAELVRSIVEKGHLAATEFDYFLFGVEGYSRVTEVQLVRKRIASYLIKSGRVDKHGKRSFDVVLPDAILGHRADCTLPNGETVTLSAADLLSMLEEWYDAGVDAGYKEEELRYLKPQATEFKALIGMNARAAGLVQDPLLHERAGRDPRPGLENAAAVQGGLARAVSGRGPELRFARLLPGKRIPESRLPRHPQKGRVRTAQLRAKGVVGACIPARSAAPGFAEHTAPSAARNTA